MNPPIRILHVLSAMDMAGTETLIMSFYRQVNRLEIQFDFAVSATKECAYDKEILSMGGLIFHYPRYKVTNHFAYKQWWEKFLSEHQEYKIIHGHIGSTAAIYLSVAKKYNRIAIAHSHSTKGENNLHGLLYRLWSYPTRYIADYFFGCSKQALTDRYGKKVSDNSKIASVLNNAINASSFIFDSEVRKEIRGEYNIGNEEFVLGTVGRLAPPKNPLFTIEILKELNNRGVNFKMLWFGKGPMEVNIKNKLKEYDLTDRVILAGNRPDVNRVLQAMDIFLFPSVWEGLGIACVEAQASGLVTICSNTIPIEAKITKYCYYLPIDDAKCWADYCVYNKNYERENCYEAIQKAGFDIVKLASHLSQFYLNIKH